VTATDVNVLSVDVEEYYHAAVFREATVQRDQKAWPSRVEASVHHLLEVFDRTGARGTFFTLGEVARAHPSVVRDIARAGHEVACHGDRHETVWSQSPSEFRADVHRAKAALEEVTGEAILGYRAPNFSIGRDQAWAYDVLIDEGFRYDSSVYPIRHDRYGDPHAPRFPRELRRSQRGTLMEFPVGTVRILGCNLPIGGGGYFRLLPLAWTVWGIRRVNRQERRPVMFYTHPWELDPHQPRPPMRWRHRLRHYVGMERQAKKLEALMRGRDFVPAREALGLTPELRRVRA
jgi:polysaccharide deacetylase family protein (PEP-CTERM system associated)